MWNIFVIYVSLETGDCFECIFLEKHKCSLLYDSLLVMVTASGPQLLVISICMCIYEILHIYYNGAEKTKGRLKKPGTSAWISTVSRSRITAPRINFMYTYLLLQTMRASWRDLVLGLVSWAGFGVRRPASRAVCHCLPRCHVASTGTTATSATSRQLLLLSLPFLGRW